MQLFGPSHLAVILLIPLLAAALIWPARNSDRRTRIVARVLAAALALTELSALALAMRDHDLNFGNALPMHLCDWTVGLLIVTLLTGWRPGYEIAYFWALAGTSHALLTPDLAFDFPDPRFLTFFAAHGGVMVSVLFLTLAAGMRPQPVSILKAMIAINVYLVVTLAVNALLDANYGYLCAKPERPTLMDHLGPWPWYLLSLEVLAFLSFLLCYSPFFIADHWKRNRRA